MKSKKKKIKKNKNIKMLFIGYLSLNFSFQTHSKKNEIFFYFINKSGSVAVEGQAAVYVCRTLSVFPHPPFLC
jgi:hypothetical protein